MKYPVIFIDPPWPFRVWNKATGSGRSAEKHYRTMSWEQIIDLGPYIDAVAAKSCALLVWATRPSQHTVINLIEQEWSRAVHLYPKKKDRWVYKTELFTWVKMVKDGSKARINNGYYSRSNTEAVMLFMRGEPLKRLSTSVPQVIFTYGRDRHSRKPHEAYLRAAQLFSGPMLELFAREQREGWRGLGDEIDSLDIRDALRQLAKESES